MLKFEALVNWAQTHLYTTLFVAWLFSNVASSLPAPDEGSSKFYRWLFTFMTATFGMIPRILATLYPDAWAKIAPKQQQEKLP